MVRLAIKLPSETKEIEADFLKTLLPRQVTTLSKGIFIPETSTLAEAEQLLIEAALKRTNFNRKLAAKQLGISERTLRRKLKHK
jgi:DNA-binding NtrC family response regulator